MFIVNSEPHHKENSVCVASGGGAGGGRKGSLPWLSVEVLFMSPEMKEDSDCFLTVSFHIRLMRLWVERKAAIDQDSTWGCCYSRPSGPEDRVAKWVCDSRSLHLYSRGPAASWHGRATVKQKDLMGYWSKREKKDKLIKRDTLTISSTCNLRDKLWSRSRHHIPRSVLKIDGERTWTSRSADSSHLSPSFEIGSTDRPWSHS